MLRGVSEGARTWGRGRSGDCDKGILAKGILGGTLVIKMITCNYFSFRELIFRRLQLQLHF